MHITCLVDGRNIIGEGPLWHPQEQAIYWVDILGSKLHRFDALTKQHQYWPMPEMITSIVLHKENGLMATSRAGFAHITLPSGELKLLNPVLHDHEQRLRFNDGKCDRQGRYWAGTMDMQATATIGALYCLEGSGKATQADMGFILSNGLGWSPDNTVMYFTDSIAQTIYQYDFNPKEGKITNKRIFAVVPKEAGVPDGLAVDSEGYIWSAHWDGWRITRYHPSGKIDRKVDLPTRRPTSCCFGGKDFNMLYITSARFDLNEEDLKQDLQAGGLFAMETDVLGLPEAFYGA